MGTTAFLRRTVAAIAIVALAAAPAALARGQETGIELIGGSGRAVLTMRGAALGSLERGRITVRISSANTQVKVEGHDWTRRSGGEITYGGTGIRFRIFRGQWRATLVGSGINVSAVGRGTVGLHGSGQYSLGGARAERWPGGFEVIRLGNDGRPGGDGR